MIYPMAMMVLLIFVVGINALVVRVNSVRSGQMSAAYFSVMKGRATEEVLKATRVFNNQFEVPVLFFAGAILCVVLQIENAWSMVTAWSFVVARIVHAMIFMTYNKLMHRLAAFLVSFLSVMLLWCGLVWQVV